MDEATNLLTNNVNSSWFPRDTVLVSWKPYKLLRSNIEYIMKFSQLHVTPGGDTSNTCKAFSFFTIIKTLAGMRADFDYYGTTDTDILTQHLFSLLNYLSQSPVFQEVINRDNDGGFRIQVLLPIEIDRRAIEEVMSNKLGFENEIPSSDSNCILVERLT